MNKCLHCGNEPTIIDNDGLFYVRCQCNKYNPFEFVAITRKKAIEQWNQNNPTPYTTEPKDNTYFEYRNHRTHFIYDIDGTIVRTRRDAARILGVSEICLYQRFKRGKTNIIIVKNKKVTRILKKGKKDGENIKVLQQTDK